MDLGIFRARVRKNGMTCISSTADAKSADDIQPSDVFTAGAVEGQLNDLDVVANKSRIENRLIWGDGQKTKKSVVMFLLPDVLVSSMMEGYFREFVNESNDTNGLILRYPGHGVERLMGESSAKMETFTLEKTTHWLKIVMGCLRAMGDQCIVFAEGKGFWLAEYMVLYQQSVKNCFIGSVHVIKPAMISLLCADEIWASRRWELWLIKLGQYCLRRVKRSQALANVYRRQLFRLLSVQVSNEYDTKELENVWLWLLEAHKFRDLDRVDVAHTFYFDSDEYKQKSGVFESWRGWVKVHQVRVIRVDKQMITTKGLGFFECVSQYWTKDNGSTEGLESHVKNRLTDVRQVGVEAVVNSNRL